MHQALSLCADLVQSGGTAVSDADTQEILKVKVNLPMENKSVDKVEWLSTSSAMCCCPQRIQSESK